MVRELTTNRMTQVHTQAKAPRCHSIILIGPSLHVYDTPANLVPLILDAVVNQHYSRKKMFPTLLLFASSSPAGTSDDARL